MIKFKYMAAMSWLGMGVVLLLGLLFPDGDTEIKETANWIIVVAICVATSNIIVLMPERD